MMALPPVSTAMSCEHLLAAVAEAGGLDGGDLEDAAELVDDQGGEGLALDVLGDDEQAAPCSGDLAEQLAIRN
jgi:hypothetical protein